MKYAKLTLATVILLLAASVAWAQCGVVACPAPCPVVVQPCPAPCPVVVQPCPQACACPCPEAVPAAMGAGPASVLPCEGCGFDAAYAGSMYAQNSVIIAVTAYGTQRASNDNLRDISSEINGYLTSANSKLQAWYGVVACSAVAPDCAKADAIIAQLSATPASCFDAVYARTLSELLRQSNAADSIGGTRAMTPAMRQQAQFLSGKEADWTFRLDRWVTDHG
jgi:hypothetical protein